MAKLKYEYKQIKVNFTVEQHQELSVIADEKGVTLAQLLRNCVGFEIEDKRIPREHQQLKIEMKVDKDWCYEINRIGWSLNKAVKEMHTNGGLIELRALQNIIDSITELNKNVCSLVKAKK